MTKVLVMSLMLMPIAAFADSGNDRYPLTKLEWLEMQVFELCSIRNSPSRNVNLIIAARPPDTLEITAMYSRQATTDQVNLPLKECATVAKATAQMRKWSWAKITAKTSLIQD